MSFQFFPQILRQNRQHLFLTQKLKKAMNLNLALTPTASLGHGDLVSGANSHGCHACRCTNIGERRRDILARRTTQF